MCSTRPRQRSQSPRGDCVQRSKRRTPPRNPRPEEVMGTTDSDALAARLERIETLLSVIAKVSMAPVLAEELKDERMARLYEMTGTTTVQAATKALGCSATTIS